MDNPLDGILPDLNIFGDAFTTIWQRVAGGLWGLGILVAVAYLGIGILGMVQNKGSHPSQLRESKADAVKAGWALGGLVALPVIVGAFLLVFGG